jgi:hypothetical protein
MSEPSDRSGGSSAYGAGRGFAHEIGRGLVVVGLTGSSVGGVVGLVAFATRLLGR